MSRTEKFKNFRLQSNRHALHKVIIENILQKMDILI